MAVLARGAAGIEGLVGEIKERSQIAAQLRGV